MITMTLRTFKVLQQLPMAAVEPLPLRTCRNVLRAGDGYRPTMPSRAQARRFHRSPRGILNSTI